ncbi:MAG TPA: polysaccharide deacetylase family protein [Candidatus Sulfotelmatobacter sp.]|nr:polysaccharide deacetylase family protein [Candidatus Sulfotelmatobacter sp.]
MRRNLLAVAIALVLTPSALAQSKTIAERLGYPRDAKLLILHADDLAVAHSEDAASFDALDKNAITSASVMIPCPWLNEVAAYAKSHPDADLGLHLTLTSEWKTYRWGPVESKDKVPSLLDPSGYLWQDTPLAVRAMKVDEAEREIRAQIERAIAMGIHPTHLDSHMGALFSRPDLFAVYVKVAREYKLPFLPFIASSAPSELSSVLSKNDALVDSVVIAGQTLQAGDWKTFYANAIRDLKPGVTEIIVHLGSDDAELRAVTVDYVEYGAAWRQRDYDVVTSPDFKKRLQDSHVILIKWKDLKKLLN